MIRVTLRFAYTAISENSDPVEALDALLSKWEKPHSIFPIPELDFGGKMTISRLDDGRVIARYPARITINIENVQDLKIGILEAIRIALPEFEGTTVEIEACKVA